MARVHNPLLSFEHLIHCFHQQSALPIDILKLLQGDVYDEEEPKVLKEMRKIVTVVEKDEKHIWHNFLGDLDTDTLGRILKER